MMGVGRSGWGPDVPCRTAEMECHAPTLRSSLDSLESGALALEARRHVYTSNVSGRLLAN